MLPSILVVETNLDLAEIIQLVLKTYDFPCTVARHGEWVLDLVKSQNFALIISEYDVYKSLEAARDNLLNYLSGTAIQVLHMVGSDTPDELAPDSVLQKPFDIDVLLAMVKSKLRLS